MLFQVQQLLHFAFHQPADGNARPAGDHRGDSSSSTSSFINRCCPSLDCSRCLFGGELLFELDELAVLELGDAIEVVLALGLLDLLLGLLDRFAQRRAGVPIAPFSDCPAGAQRVGLFAQLGELLLEFRQALARGGVGFLLQRLALDLELHDAARGLVELGRHRVDLGAQLGRRLVDQVDGLVGQEAVGDVAVRQHRGSDQGAVLDAHAVVHLVALAQAAQDRDGVLDARLVDHHRLEAPLERRVLLDVLAVLVEGGGADAVQLAARQHRLEQIARRPWRLRPRPAPTTVCSSSMNRMTSPPTSCTSLSTALRRSSNSPRNLAPAIRAPMSRATDALLLQPFRARPCARCAAPGPRRSRSCRRRARRSGPGCSWCGATAPG